MRPICVSYPEVEDARKRQDTVDVIDRKTGKDAITRVVDMRAVDDILEYYSGDHITVRDHHTFGSAGCARGVNEEGRIFCCIDGSAFG